MRITSQRSKRVVVPGIAAVALTAVLAGCGAGNEEGSGGGGGAEETGLSGTIAGAGASSQEAAQGAWQSGFLDANPDVTVNYDPIGSSGGREQFIDGGVAFAGSDAYMDDEELAAATERCGGTDPIEVPAYVSPIAVIFNLEGVDELQLDPETITGIFEGDITTWDDPAIAATNDGVELPSTDITPVHRGDDSGTTENFTEYLAAAGGWSEEPSDVWPIQGGEAATGTSGVVEAVGGGDGTIGYADASQAGDLSAASVQVGDEFVAPSPEAAAEIINASPRVEGREANSMAVDIDRETEEAGVYPVVLASYMIACETYEDADEAELVKAYLSYVVSPDGQQAAAETAGSAPLSDDVSSEATEIVDKIS
ncbi:phosphate ABC transporter substrate-binding protein PstS [Nocardioides sp. CFH 31398]|uniref:phosphate ABC transporter substrate-binding protein PstS n=1 Tax=Nocardioides sp. CFH 31398 TaxID=2919579 RepID=UPI001F063BD7|nr:phosphate ABC transporter substrate-binding protein PstS [Nocardioides sp. CFH 31398]MCH1866040.1 phosphate ABC transporter substrate-binding protein PstS [Nocardioides sp. CFH 31398]